MIKRIWIPPSYSFKDLKLVDITGLNFLLESHLFSFKHTYPFDMVKGEYVSPPELFFSLPDNFLPPEYPSSLRKRIFQSEVKYCLELYERLRRFNDEYHSYLNHRYLFFKKRIERQFNENNQGIRMLGRTMLMSIFDNSEVLNAIKEDNNLFLCLSSVLKENEYSDLAEEFSEKLGTLADRDIDYGLEI